MMLLLTLNTISTPTTSRPEPTTDITIEDEPTTSILPRPLSTAPLLMPHSMTTRSKSGISKKKMFLTTKHLVSLPPNVYNNTIEPSNFTEASKLIWGAEECYGWVVLVGLLYLLDPGLNVGWIQGKLFEGSFGYLILMVLFTIKYFQGWNRVFLK